MKTNVRSYTNEELLNKVKSLPSFIKIPGGVWILGIRSNEDSPDEFDDKFYVFKDEEFVTVLSGSTNPGTYGLLNFLKWDKRGTAVIKADEWYYSVWERGLHNDKMEALRQVGEFKVIRDNNKNKKSGDNTSWTLESNKGLNFHTVSYDSTAKIVRTLIGQWNTGCQTPNDTEAYYKLMRETRPQKRFTYCLLDEF